MLEKIDYKKINFKAGLEIHQQLDSHKLFCSCPSVLRKDEPNFEIKRKLHAVAGESGEVDVAAQYQAKLNKEFIYQGYDSTCLVELDEDPPHEINGDALKIALQIAILMNCNIIPITQVMRKTVIDGSNTSGFQRTVMIAYGGYIETSRGQVGINAIMLEEDAARIIERGEKKEIYRLDRLGIPLVEVVTAPDIKDGVHAQETALIIGDILRSCRVKRGLGTIRQDISISIKGGNRVELKGVQDIDLLPTTVENEVRRQLELEKNKTPVLPEVRNSLVDGKTEFLRPMPGSSRMYPETDILLLKISRDKINDAKKDLPKLRSEVEEDLKRKGLSQEMIKLLFKEGNFEDFKELVKIYDNVNFVAKVMLIFTKEIASKEKLSEDISENRLGQEVLVEILKLVDQKKLAEDNVKEVMIRLARGENFENSIKVEKIDFNEVEEFVIKTIKEKPGLNANAYMGLVMKEFKGKVSGKEAMEIIGKNLKN